MTNRYAHYRFPIYLFENRLVINHGILAPNAGSRRLVVPGRQRGLMVCRLITTKTTPRRANIKI
jgi:hypothetical protein